MTFKVHITKKYYPKSDGTIYLDNSYKKSTNIPQEVVDSITSWMSTLNDDVKAKKATISDTLQVNYIGQKANTVVSMTSSGGINNVYVYWSGFDLYLSHSSVKAISGALTAGASAAALASLISGEIPTPPSKVASVIVKVAGWIAGTGDWILTSNENGNGVIIEVAWPAVPFNIKAQ